MRLLRTSSVMDQRDARTTAPHVASPPPLLDLRQRRLAATARTAISGPSTKISARFLCCNVGSTQRSDVQNGKAALPHKMVMVLTHRSRVYETRDTSPADVASSWYGLSPTLRLTLDLAPVGTPGCCL